jgi:NAD(P)-dependent dehydrogenase (short-subunit alcohol dehydrogenase family)
MELASARAVISGGASGLGLAVAERVVGEGGSVLILDVQDAAGRQAASRLGPRASYQHCDVTREDEVDGALRTATERLGSVTLAVSCAGVATPGRVLGRDGPLKGEIFRRVIDINLIGTFLLDKAAAAAMQNNAPTGEGERGVIVHTASVAAFDGQIGQAAYSASKAAVAGMTLPLARELARLGIRVVTIAPGLFETPMMAGLPEEAQRSLAQQVPFPARLGRPVEYAALVASIYSNPMLNGETIRLDGALRMQPK